MVLYPNKLPESERVCSGICTTQCKKEENWNKVMIYIYKKHIDTYIHHYGSPLEILDKMWYYKGKYEKYYNTWYRRFWHKIRPRSKRRR